LRFELQQRTGRPSPYGPEVFFVSLFATLLHLFLMWLPGINLEWVFADGAKYFDCRDPLLLKRYFFLEANTLGMPFLAFAFHHALPFLTYSAILRALSASSFLLLGYALSKLHWLLERDYNPAVLLAVVFLNPLIWTFGGRATADLFPAALALFAISLFWEGSNSPARLVIAIATYGIAITLKYHAALLLPLLGLEMLTRPGAVTWKRIAHVCIVIALILVIPGCYLILVKHLYGFWFAPPKFREMHGLHLSLIGILMNLIGYVAYLFLLLLPYSLRVIWTRINTARKALITLGAAIVIFVLGAYGVSVGAEMRFGPLDAYVSPRIYSGIFLVFAAMCVLWGKEVWVDTATTSGRRYLFCMLLGVAMFIGILSLARPAQRYLLFVLPLSYFFVITRGRSERFLNGIAILFYAVLILFITLNQAATGAVSQKMLQQIIARGLLNDTYPGAILLGSVGDRFPDLDEASTKRYTVIAGSNSKAIVTVEDHPGPMVHKVLSLVRREDAAVTDEP